MRNLEIFLTVEHRDATYPVDYSYDEFGDKVSMITYRDINNAGDVTRWLRDEATGLVTNKVYADGKGPRYDYTPDGKLATRTWARGIVTTYSYDDNGALTNTVYSDGTPTISIVYNRAGRQIEAHDAAGITTFLYDDFGSLTNETIIGVAGTNTIERFYDTFGRNAGYALNGIRQSTLAYDPATGSLVSISDAVANTEYSYSSDLLDTGYTLTLSNGEVLSRSVIRDERCRLLVTGIVSLENGNSIDSFTYAYDVLSRPTQRNCDTFCYNDRSEVTSATIAAEEPYLTSTFYGYDDIGNLTMSTSNSGSSSFAANGLNQYTSICSDFASLCEPTYDIDGNMLSNGDITFTYDSKSRLVAAAGQNGEYIVSNRYDHLDRRVQKVTPAATHTYFYDGWMLIKEIVANTNGTTDVVEYHWGKDLSGTIGGAGGVGGLLYLKRNGAVYVPWYDAYGNVMGYWDAQGNVVAEYTYDAFGKLISISGPMADVFAFRYSTKYFDVETGFYYYGYRYYSPELKRWITRDPIGEEGGVNLYAMCGNNPLDDYDVDGYKPASKKADSSWTLFGSVTEIHSWNCSEWPTLTDGSSCGTQAKYVAHFQKVTFAKNIKVPSRYVTLFSYGIVSALEMNKDTKSAWCLSLTPLEVWRKKRDSGGFDYKVVMTITNFDKHPTLKDKPEIPIKSYIGKKVEYNPYGN